MHIDWHITGHKLMTAIIAIINYEITNVTLLREGLNKSTFMQEHTKRYVCKSRKSQSRRGRPLYFKKKIA